jgi:hypothetical protein
MTLSKDDIDVLNNAIKSYDFPCVYYDFSNNCRIEHTNMSLVEESIKSDLISANPEFIKNGLSNVLYWGFERVGYRNRRVNIFREQVTEEQLKTAACLFANIHGDRLREIKEIGLPQFSGMSFITKIRMFLDPENYVILDRQILQMRHIYHVNLLNDINFGNNETQIRISNNNVRIYLVWCKKCREISVLYYDNNYRSVDIERGFFTLIQRGKVDLAAKILSMA